MSDSFDPYHKWLGISPKDRPLTYYRLLGVDLFEDDPQVIDVAADRQMAHLRSFQTGPQGSLSQKLLNEIAAARLCLLNPEKKAAYDRKLRAATMPVAKALPMAEPLAPTPPERKPTLLTRQASEVGTPANMPAANAYEAPAVHATSATCIKSKPIWQQPIVWSVALGVVALVLVGLIFFRGRTESVDVAVNENTDAALNVKNATSTNPSENPTLDPDEQQDPAVAKLSPQPTDPPEQSQPSTTTTKEPVGAAKVSPEKEEAKDPDSSTESLPAGIDLLKSIDLKRDVVEGTWQLEDGHLVCESGYRSRVVVGPVVPERYRLDIEYQHVKGQSPCIGLVLGDHQAMVLMDTPTQNGTLSGIHKYREIYLDNGTQSFPAELFCRDSVLNGDRGRIVCLVEPGKIWVACNGKQVVNWSGDTSELTLYHQWEIPEKNRIFLGAHQAAIRYERAVLTPLKSWPKNLPTGKEPGPAETIASQPDPNESSPDQSIAKATPLPKGIDLLKTANLQRDVVKGEWKFEGGKLEAQSGSESRLLVGKATPERYRLDVDFQYLSGIGCCIGLVVGDHQTMLLIDFPTRYGGIITGVHKYLNVFVDNSLEGFPKELYTRDRVLEDGHGRLVCLVEPGRIWVTCNGKKVADWSGDFSQLGLYDFWNVSDKNRLFFGAHHANIRFKRAVLTPLREWPKIMPSGSEPIAADAVARQAIPDQIAQEKVQAQLHEVFEKEYKDTRPDSKAALARQLISEATKSSLDSPERFVMFHEGGLLAAEVGDAKLFEEALTPLAEDYADPQWSVPLALFAQLASSSKSIEARESFSALAIEWSRRALKENRYDAALKLASDGASAVARTKDIDARKRAAAYRESVEQIQAVWKATRDAIEVLKKTPDDAAANLTVGKFLCFAKQDWDAGLAHLAQGSDGALQQLAADEVKQPKDAAARLALADQWWEAGNQLKDHEKTSAQDRSAYWYLQAENELQGLEKARVGKKLREMGVIVDVLSTIKPSRTNARGNWLYDKKMLVSPADPMAAIQFSYEPPTEYDIILTAQRIKSQESIEYGQDAFVFGLSHAGNQFLLVADWYVHGRARDLALYATDGQGPGDQSPYHTYASIFGEKPVTVTVSVRNERIVVEADGKQLANWAVNYSRLSLPKEWTPADRKQLFIGSRKCNFRITQFDVVQVTR